MSIEYNNYLLEHISNVQKGLDFFKEHMPDILTYEGNYYLGYALEEQFANHDKSKYDEKEYAAYDAYFYGGNKTQAVLDEFNRAWLHHIHHNPHHWQYYVLIQDDDKTICVEMPYCYVLEMLCDWWAFSWKNGDLFEIFEWYEKHKNHILLNPKTRKVVEDILTKLRAQLAIKRIIL